MLEFLFLPGGPWLGVLVSFSNRPFSLSWSDCCYGCFCVLFLSVCCPFSACLQWITVPVFFCFLWFIPGVFYPSAGHTGLKLFFCVVVLGYFLCVVLLLGFLFGRSNPCCILVFLGLGSLILVLPVVDVGVLFLCLFFLVFSFALSCFG